MLKNLRGLFIAVVFLGAQLGYLETAQAITLNAGGGPPHALNTIVMPIRPHSRPISNTFIAGGSTSSVPGSVFTGNSPTFLLPSLTNMLSNAIESKGTVVIDVSKLTTPGVLDYSGNFKNVGKIYLISTDPNDTTVTLSASNIFNAHGATITTVLPKNGLPGITGAISNLDLILNAGQSIWNAGSISSSGNLTAIAANALVNALPAGTNGTGPVMQAANNLTIHNGNITNAGMLLAQAGNISINTASPSTININNAGGTIQAAGYINIRDAAFAGKYDTNLIGGNVLGDAMSIYSGTGSVTLNVDTLTPSMTVFAGDAFIIANSNVKIANLELTGDPVIQGANLEFTSDTVDGVPTGISTVNVPLGATLTAVGNAMADSDVFQIDANQLPITVGGSINLSGVAIQSNGPVVFNAQNISTGSISAQSVFMTSAHGISAPSISAQAFVDLNANTSGGSSPLVIGSQSGVGSVSVATTASPTNLVLIHIANGGSGGISIASANAVSMSVPNTIQRDLLLDAGTGTLALPSGTISVDSTNQSVPGGNIFITAGQVTANGTSLSANNTAGGQAGTIAIGANSIDYGSGGLTLQANGQSGQIGVSGTGSVQISTQLQLPIDLARVGFTGTTTVPLTFKGTGPLNIHTDGTGIPEILMLGGPMTFPAGTVNITANGTGNNGGGLVELAATGFTNNATSFKAAANGAGTGSGGVVSITSLNDDASGDIKLGGQTGAFNLSATSGTNGGSGGVINVIAGHLLNVDNSQANSINVDALGPDGNGGSITLVGGSSTSTAGGGITFGNTNSTTTTTLEANGKGNGAGGTITVVALAPGSNITLGSAAGNASLQANAGTQGAGGSVSVISQNAIAADGSAVSVLPGTNGGSGGTVLLASDLSNANSTLKLSGDFNANGTGNGNGGSIDLEASSVSFTGSTTVSTNGGATGSGGAQANGGGIAIISQGANALNLGASAVSLQSKGGATSGDGGDVVIQSGGPVTIGAGSVIDASAIGANNAGGTVFFAAATSNSTQTVTNNGTISALGNTNGQVVFNATRDNTVSVNVTSSGAIKGEIVSIGGATSIQSTLPNGGLTIGSIVANSGDITITATATGSHIDLVPGIQGTRTIQAVNGNISLTADRLNLGISADGQTVSTANGDLVLANGNVVLQTNSTSNGDIVMASDVSASGAITIAAHGTGNIVQSGDSGNRIDGGTGLIKLSTDQGNIGSVNRPLYIIDALDISANTKQTTALGGVALNQGIFLQINTGTSTAPSDVKLEASSTGNMFVIKAGSNVIINGALTAGLVDIATEVSGNINVDASITATESVTLTAGELNLSPSTTASILTNGSTTAVITAPMVKLHTLTGDIGSSTAPILTAADKLETDTDFQGSVFVKEKDNVILENSTINGDYSLTLAGTLTEDSNAQVNLVGSTIRLEDTNGAIGTASNPLIVIDQGDTDLSVTSTQGGAFLDVRSTGSVTLEAIPQSTPINGPFFLKASNTLFVNDVYAQGSITLQSNAGQIVVRSASVVSANGGSILINVLNPSAGTGINIADGAQVLTPAGGNITIGFGSDPASGATRFIGTTFAGLSVTTANGALFLGPQGQIFTAGSGQLNAFNGNITLNAGGTNGIIQLGAGVLIQTGQGRLPPARGGQPPGQSSQPPGQDGQNPGQSGGTSGPPGQNQSPPGLGQNPGQGDPPGQQQAPPGQQSTTASTVQMVAFTTLSNADVVVDTSDDE